MTGYDRRASQTIADLYANKTSPGHILLVQSTQWDMVEVLRYVSRCGSPNAMRDPKLDPEIVCKFAHEVIRTQGYPHTEFIEDLLQPPKVDLVNTFYPDTFAIKSLHHRKGIHCYGVQYEAVSVPQENVPTVEPERISSQTDDTADSTRVIIHWQKTLTASFNLPTPCASAVYAFNGALLEYQEGNALRHFLKTNPKILIRNRPPTRPSGTHQTGRSRVVLVRWENDPLYWRFEHGAAVDAIRALSHIDSANFAAQQGWYYEHRIALAPLDTVPELSLHLQPVGPTPCVSSSLWGPVALIGMVLQVVGSHPGLEQPIAPNHWLVLLESLHAGQVGVFTDALHLTQLSVAMTLEEFNRLLRTALQACGWTTTEFPVSSEPPTSDPSPDADEAIVLQHITWTSDHDSSFWSTRLDDHRLMAILQCTPEAWGTLRAEDQFLVTRPSDPHPLMRTCSQPAPPVADGPVVLIWMPSSVMPDLPECNYDHIANAVTVECDLCGRTCNCGGHFKTSGDFRLCIECFRRRGNTPSEPYCEICVLPLREQGLHCGSCHSRVHTACAGAYMSIQLDSLVVSCRTPMCNLAANAPSAPFSGVCMGCFTHLTLEPDHLRCTGLCGRGWCPRCKPSTRTLCRQCLPVR
jgi:hypothetical protein